MELFKDIAAIAQTGATGIALFLAWILWKVVTNHTAHTDEIIKENSKSTLQLSETMGSHTEVLRSLKETIDRKL